LAYSPDVRRALQELEEASIIAHREAVEAMPAIARHGDAVLAEWLDAGRILFLYEREAGKAFIRGSRAVEEVAEEVLPWTRQALKFAELQDAAKVIEGFMAQLPDAYGVLGHDGEPRWAELGLRWCSRHLESGAVYFETSVRALAARQRMRGVEQVMDPAEGLFATRRLALGSYLPGALKVRNLFGADAILPWAHRGADILQSGRLRGEAYFRLESEESLQVLKEQLPGYLVADHQRLLQMLVAAWYGVGVVLKEGDWSPERGRGFAETDGRIVFLPVVFPDREEAVLAVLHTAGHVMFGSYRRSDLEALFAEAGVGALPRDGENRVPWHPLLAGFDEDRSRFELLFDLAEDLRVDCAINRVVPNHLRRMLALADARQPPPGAARPYFELARETLRFATARLAGAAGSDGGSVLDRLAPLMEPDASLADAFRIARALNAETTLPPVGSQDERQAAYLPGRSPNTARSVAPDEKDEEPGSGTGADQEEAAGEPRLGKDEEAAAEAGGEAGEENPQPEPSATTGTPGKGIPQPLRATGHQGTHPGEEKGIPYPEWDYRDRRYKRNWVWVQERRLEESNLTEAERLHARHADALARLKKAILAQKPTRLAPKSRQWEGDDVDLDAAIGFITEKRAGRSPAARVYRQRRVQSRETAVTLLADLSTSVMQQLPDGEGRVVDRIRAGILLFAESMEVVGDAYCIAGFCSKYRQNVSYYDIKGFDEPFTQEVRGVIGGLSGRLATRMGAAIRHALSRFHHAPSRRRLLLILSDGRPEDYDDGGDVRYLHEDTRIAVKEAVDQGVHPFCITVDPAGSDYLPRIFGAGHYLVLDHINSLPKKLPEIYLRLRG